MNIKDRMILSDFKARKNDLIAIDGIVLEKLRSIVKTSHVLTAGIEHRIKSENSLEGKLYKSGDRYQKLLDLHDLVGARIICYFNDGVTLIGEEIEKHFNVDWEKSGNKRHLLSADSFGYLSLHYICSLRKEDGYPENLTDIKFEIQIRTILQHAWAAIDHDLGYKNEFGTPKEVTREFARLAGLLEIADDEFMRIRNKILEYTEITRKRIINNDVEDINIDLISLREYMNKNIKINQFIKKVADIEGSEISYIQPDNYIEQLNYLNIKTLGELQRMLDDNEELAYKLAVKSLKGTELDILASNTVLRFLTRAYILTNNYSEQQIIGFLMLSVKNEKRASRQAKMLLNSYSLIKSE